eukprot:CAMPEP_0194227084 /NCGR_PEP_ID=MMETSP0156-20130528/42677_1 /TAXON_ID=33649 /ORGANISM="Thalassionema nitzschioides, Strain L26-B" /LENGTH=263 /DNA_ID=CAMNT_0038959557 /DNA_START=521 /DNA_END=1312 /DNA_ORIENTATION=-
MTIYKRQPILIFDWDDTILPSSFVDQWNIEHVNELPPHFQKLFNELGRCAEQCLATASIYGEVIIITNSDEGWVRFSAERFIPHLLPVIEKYRIVSARTRYEKFYPQQPMVWKAAAFAHEVNEIYETGKQEVNVVPMIEESDVSSDDDSARSEIEPIKSRNREIISIGDSIEERNAVQVVSRQFSAIPKSVMFISNPSPLQLIGQLNMLTKHMEFVCSNESSLDLEISPHQAQRCAEIYLEQIRPARTLYQESQRRNVVEVEN